MAYSLTEAAAAAGRNRSTIVRAIKSGKLSASRDEPTGEWRLEPAELHRVYPVADASGTTSGDATAVLEAQLEAERAMVAVLERVNADLSKRLDIATEQLGEALQQVRQLTDQRPALRGWWRWR